MDTPLGCDLQVPLPLKLIIEVVDPLLSIGALLASQVNPCAELLYGPEQIVQQSTTRAHG